MGFLDITDDEWQQQVQTRILSTDDAIISFLQESTTQATFDALLNSYSTATKLLAHIRQNHPSFTNRISTLQSYITLIISYSGLVLTDLKEMAKDDQLSLGPEHITQCILNDQISTAFFQDLIVRFKGDGLDAILNVILEALRNEMKSSRVSKNNWSKVLKALAFIVTFEEIVQKITSLPSFSPINILAQNFEHETFFGPFLCQPTVFGSEDKDINVKYFPSIDSQFGTAADSDINGYNIGPRNPSDVKSALKTLQGVSSETSLFNIFMTIIKTSPESKEAVLAYIARALNINQSRGKLHVDKKAVSSDGFMHNLLSILLKLSEPILDVNFSKLPLIDPAYFIFSDRLDNTGATRINADDNTYLAFYEAQKLANVNHPPPNFISEIFYTTAAGLHFGLLGTIRWYFDTVKAIEENKKQLAQMKQTALPGNPFMDARLRKWETDLDDAVAMILSYNAILLDVNYLSGVLRFYDLVVAFLLRSVFVGLGNVAHGGKADSINWASFVRGSPQNLNFTIGTTNPMVFASLPEWMFEDVCEFYLFVSRFNPTVFETLPRDEFFTFAMFFLHNSNLLKNPYHKSKLIEVLFNFTRPLYYYADGTSRGHLDGPFSSHPYCRDYLLPSVLQFYVDVEKSGMQNQFYEKFNIRYNISKILKSVWTFQRAKFIELSRNADFFTQFVAMLMNDTTYLLDDGIAKILEIKKLQDEKNNIEVWNALSEDDKKNKMEQLANAERVAPGSLGFANNSVHMWKFYTSEPGVVAPIVESILVDRLAAMMNHNLAVLTGPQRINLKVPNPEKYAFKPKVLLGEFLQTFANLAARDEFALACARDSRSFNPDNFERGLAVLHNDRLIRSDDIARLREFVKKVESNVKLDAEEDEAYGEIPDDYLDPLMYTLMVDPVKLPTSNTIVDRSTIIQHLLSDEHDPFNRKPLTIDMVINAIELKAEIEAWKKSKKLEIGQ